MNTTLRWTRRGMAALAAALLAAACLDDRPVGPQPDPAMPVRLGLQANVVNAAAGQKVRIRTFYRRVGGTSVTLENTPSEVNVTPGVSQTVSVEVRVDRCLADSQRETATNGACEIGVELTLLDESGGVIDQQATSPSGPATPGTSVTIRDPITLADVSAITVSPIPSLRIGETRTLTATATDASGGPLTRAFTWTSDNPSVLTVNATTGAAIAVGPGTARVTASSGTKSGSGSVRVLRRVAEVSLSPSPAPSLQAAATLTFNVVAKDESGADAGDLSERSIVWTASNPDGATRTASVAPNGTVTGLYPGNADISVSVDGVAATARVRITGASVLVTPASGQLVVGGTVGLQASVLDANGVALPGVGITWSSSANSVATVSSNGAVTAVAAGEATITASGGGVSGTATISVGTLSLTVSPNISNLIAGNTLAMTVTGALGQVTWRSTNTAIATVGADGVVLGRFPGRTTIEATVPVGSGTQRGTATIDVAAAQITVFPAQATIYEFETIQFTATARDSKGVALVGVPISWSSSDPQYAPVTSTGVVHALYETVANIRAFGGGTSGSARLTVVPGEGSGVLKSMIPTGLVTVPAPTVRRKN